MHSPSIAIIGAGLSGIHAAFVLAQAGITDYVVLEASGALGGRIRSEDAGPGGSGRVDLGASWYWPAMQPALDELVHRLGLRTHAQHEEGAMLVERSPGRAPERHPGYASAPTAMRIDSGMLALVQALARSIPRERLRFDQRAVHLRALGGRVEIGTRTASGQHHRVHAGHVLLALPPRLAAASIQFTPELPRGIQAAWRHTATWMAPHAKYAAVYSRPFWRAAGLSGAAHSLIGPLSEIHDASQPGGAGALFGFFGLPAPARQRMSEDALKRLCRAQCVRLFGPEAAHPLAEWIADWSQSPLTATPDDALADGSHPHPPPGTVDSGPWAQRLQGIASEWSPSHCGYVAGAIEAASAGVAQLLRGHAGLPAQPPPSL